MSEPARRGHGAGVVVLFCLGAGLWICSGFTLITDVPRDLWEEKDGIVLTLASSGVAALSAAGVWTWLRRMRNPP